MNKNELIKLLQVAEGNPVIALAVDEEGNDFQEMDYGCSKEYDLSGVEILILWPNGKSINF